VREWCTVISLRPIPAFALLSTKAEMKRSVMMDILSLVSVDFDHLLIVPLTNGDLQK